MSDTKAAIIKALPQLDAKNDDHWTSDGLPRLDVLAKLMKVSNVKRGDVTEAAPNFTKDNPTLAAPEAQGGESTTGQGADASPTPQADEAKEGAEGEQSGDDAQAADADDATDPAHDVENHDDEAQDDEELGYEPGEIDEAEAAVLEAKAKLEEAQSAANDAKAVVDKVQAEHDRLVELRDSQKRPHQDMEDRMVFIRRQHEQRAARAGLAAEALKGIDLSKLDPRSPLDRSMARKTGFGHRGRPALPLKTGE